MYGNALITSVDEVRRWHINDTASIGEIERIALEAIDKSYRNMARERILQAYEKVYEKTLNE